MVTEKEMLEYFVLENRKITLDDLYNKYKGYGKIPHISQIANALAAKEFITKVPNEPFAWVVSDKTKKQLEAEIAIQEQIKKRSKLEEDQIQSVIETNKSSKRSNIWSPVFAGLAALAAILSFFTGIIQHKQTEEKTEQLQTQLTQQGNALKIQQMQIDSLLTKVARRDTVPKAL